MRIFLLLVLTLVLNLFAFDMKQKLVLNTVKNIANAIPDSSGNRYPYTMMAICLAESDGGRERYSDKNLLRKGIKNASYGIMNVRLETARFVAKVYRLGALDMMSDVELIERMINDDVFDIKLATLYFVWLADHSSSYFEAVSRYNGGKVNYPYYNKVIQKIDELKRAGF